MLTNPLINLYIIIISNPFLLISSNFNLRFSAYFRSFNKEYYNGNNVDEYFVSTLNSMILYGCREFNMRYCVSNINFNNCYFIICNKVTKYTINYIICTSTTHSNMILK